MRVTGRGWRIEVSPQAEKDLSRLDPEVRRRITTTLPRFIANPSGVPLRKLNPNEWRLRVGDWRVRLRPDFSAKVLLVTRILHRREVYR